jgi:hypothetical protein
MPHPRKHVQVYQFTHKRVLQAVLVAVTYPAVQSCETGIKIYSATRVVENTLGTQSSLVDPINCSPSYAHNPGLVALAFNTDVHPTAIAK